MSTPYLETNVSKSIPQRRVISVTRVCFRVALLLVIYFILYLSLSKGDLRAKTSESSKQQHKAGKVIYQRHCQPCHGVKGDGNGPATEYLFPRPRDFTSGTYKFTSTPYEQPPTDGDLKRTIFHGLPGTGMPGFQVVLTEQQVQEVITYIKTFSSVFTKLEDLDPIAIPIPILPSKKLVKQGRNLYQAMGCVACHGERGKGDGEAAKEQFDQWGDPNFPRDFSKGVFKAGRRPKDIYRTIMTGVGGTGMPGYSDAFPSESIKDRWALVYYVQSLVKDSREADAQSAKTLRVKKEPFSKFPTDQAWKKAEEITLLLSPLWERPIAPPEVSISAIHNEENIAIRMKWNDATQDTHMSGHQFYTDAVALQSPLSHRSLPFFGMGDSKKTHRMSSLYWKKPGRVRIWHWQAVRQIGANQGRAVDIEDIYVNMFADRYPWLHGQKPGQLLNFQNEETILQKQDKEYQSAVDVGNPISDPSLVGHSTLEYIAEGFGTLTAVPKDDMEVEGKGKWNRGVWEIVFSRSLKVKGRNNFSFHPGKTLWISIATFDGTYQERNGKKSVSQWIKLSLDFKEES